MPQRPATCPICGGAWISKDVWWALPVPRDELATWGYLYLCAKGHPHFDLTEQPSAEAVSTRTHCREYLES